VFAYTKTPPSGGGRGWREREASTAVLNNSNPHSYDQQTYQRIRNLKEH